MIATAFGRISLLLERALPSVYQQSGVRPEHICVFIIDDNERNGQPYSQAFFPIKEGVADLRHSLQVPENHFQTHVIANRRTQGNSGTGAWNTGIYAAGEQDPGGYIGILDDDDAYLPFHLSRCVEVCQRNPNALAVFHSLRWIHEDHRTWDFPLTHDVLTPAAFFRGNPGVQGSNMFFRTDAMLAIGGFDERYPNTTDRELMIRFLWYVQELQTEAPDQNLIEVIKETGVLHYNHSQARVNGRNERKHKGLDMFYRAYRPFFSEEDYRYSLERAKAYFDYTPV
ncbi:MAG: glycosyltransferase [Bacteroidia bacterium]|nr:glycosyltransferase [Bacteroidia bacterium]